MVRSKEGNSACNFGKLTPVILIGYFDDEKKMRECDDGEGIGFCNFGQDAYDEFLNFPPEVPRIILDYRIYKRDGFYIQILDLRTFNFTQPLMTSLPEKHEDYPNNTGKI